MYFSPQDRQALKEFQDYERILYSALESVSFKYNLNNQSSEFFIGDALESIMSSEIFNCLQRTNEDID